MVFRHIREEIYQVQWVIEGELAQSQRPGYPVDRPSMQKMQEWADAVLGMGMGIRSVLSILDNAQIAHYDHLNLDGSGLFGYYRSLGLAVEHVHAQDHKIPLLSSQELELVWAAFQRPEKPVLVHCSAGRDRTGAAMVYILSRLQADGS